MDLRGGYLCPESVNLKFGTQKFPTVAHKVNNIFRDNTVVTKQAKTDRTGYAG